jgi:ParB family chromosome partitioning protein
MDLHPDVKKLLLSNHLEMGHARALLSLEGSKQVALANKVIKEGLTVRATERLVKESHADPKNQKIKLIDNDTVKLQDELTGKLGAKVTIDHKENGSGKLVITYTSLDELDGIIELLKTR